MQELMTLMLYLGVLALAAWPLSRPLAVLIRAQPLSQRWQALDRGTLTVFGLGKAGSQSAAQWVGTLVVFSVVEILVLFLILVFQDKLPLNPQAYVGVPWDLALNTAVSFVTNTNWQNYAGESTLSPFLRLIVLSEFKG